MTVTLVPPRTIPRTSSGKIQRLASREAALAAQAGRAGGGR
jgi:acyl-coenzyme A synthetase/AMP-(fatty) acid ligase